MSSPKYNRTLHLPFSPGVSKDDKIAPSIELLIGSPIIITEKMDGSNTSLEASGCYARTHSSSPTHASFDGLKALHARIKDNIPASLQLFGEWCYAKHSIAYDALPGYFLLFNVRDLSRNSTIWLSWHDVESWAKEIGVPTVPVLFSGTVNSASALQKMIESLMLQPSACDGQREGVVVRVAQDFPDEAFATSVMKYVRAHHIQTCEQWKDRAIVRNNLKKKV